MSQYGHGGNFFCYFHISRTDLRCGYLLLEFYLSSTVLVSYQHGFCCAHSVCASYVLIDCLMFLYHTALLLLLGCSL